jgi:hypothetical protein
MLKELRHCEARFLRRGNPLILKHFWIASQTALAMTVFL